MLQAFLDIAPHIPELFGTKDLVVFVTNESEYVYVDASSDNNLLFAPGMRVEEDTVPYLALKENAPRDTVKQDEKGRNWRNLCYPFAGGTIGVIYDHESRQIVQHAIEQLATNRTQIASSSQLVSTKSVSLMESVSSIEETASDTLVRNKKLLKNVSAVKEIVQQLQILRLNSSIEAARAGEQGKKFMIVAEQVHMLAVEGENRINEINKVLKEVSQHLSTLHDSVQHAAKVIKEQTVSGQRLSGLSNKINEAITSLEDKANRFL